MPERNRRIHREIGEQLSMRHNRAGPHEFTRGSERTQRPQSTDVTRLESYDAATQLGKLGLNWGPHEQQTTLPDWVSPRGFEANTANGMAHVPRADTVSDVTGRQTAPRSLTEPEWSTQTETVIVAGSCPRGGGCNDRPQRADGKPTTSVVRRRSMQYKLWTASSAHSSSGAFFWGATAGGERPSAPVQWME
jgi:hypothetical protein